MLKINGVAIATPKTFEITIKDLDGESNRNAKGEIVRDRIAVKRSLSLEWPPLLQKEISVLLNLTAEVFFTVEFPDPKEGIITKTMYVGDRTAPMYVYVDNVPKWQNLKMSFEEK